MPRAAGRRLSSRNCKGRGWHKAGYRENGNLFVQLKRGTYGFSRTHEVNEHDTMADFIHGMVSELMMEDGWCTLPKDWTIRFTAKRQTLDPESDASVNSLLDGGETVTANIFDDEGYQRTYIQDRDEETGEL
ncbi:hypothetical protein P389DRAFT_195776 [Cystobasidium minutum MCA 4210]|uniref:uncharacterized protein n=1 Tax=Cystobasidium minutum MCA 4210 TaxID=1397322 RepID=UPI0034CF648E|eukprot:jgi/Rhomi1/195776/gm1.3990_g